MIRYNVLGPLELRSGATVYTPRGPKIGRVLALLLLQANQFVRVQTLAEELWDERPPRTAVTTIRTHVYHLRTMLERGSAIGVPAGLLATEPAGYRFAVEPGQLDCEEFDRLTDRGRALLKRGAVDQAAVVLRSALELWRGPALVNLTSGPVLCRHVDQLEESRIGALELRIEADLQLGRHRELVAELRGLVATHPLNEWFHARLIEALHRCGRRGEALQAFLDLRAVLACELGVEPSAALQRIQHEILTSGARRHLRPGAPVGANRAVS